MNTLAFFNFLVNYYSRLKKAFYTVVFKLELIVVLIELIKNVNKSYNFVLQQLKVKKN